jgi:hypothetical protein
MKNFWQKYWSWSDKINAPFQKHKDRIVLYVILCQSIIVTATLLRLTSGVGDVKMRMICTPTHNNTLYCIEL